MMQEGAIGQTIEEIIAKRRVRDDFNGYSRRLPQASVFAKRYCPRWPEVEEAPSEGLVATWVADTTASRFHGEQPICSR